MKGDTGLKTSTPLYITNAKVSIRKAMRTKDHFGIFLFYEWYVACL